MTVASPQVFDVLIVGYGPVGATLANLLGTRGYRVAIVEQALNIYDKPRAITADQEAMRVFQECGLAEEISRSTVPHPGTDFVGVEGQVIKRFYPQPQPHPLAWEPSFMFIQPELEATLRMGVGRFPAIQTLLGHELLGLEQADGKVVATVRRLEDGSVQTLQALYAVACDGAKSGVRRQLATEIEDLEFDEWWLVVDGKIRGRTELPPRCVQYCRPSRPGTYIVGPGELRRWEIKMLRGESPDDLRDPATVRKVLATFVDVDAVELWRIAVYRFHALVAKRWRDGRVFLMGDAAHQMPPFLGQGLCAGIRDALNLAWKLDAVLRCGLDEHLLDSYGEEREPHVRTVVAHARAFGLIIGELDPEAARARDQQLGEELAAGRSETVRQKFIPGLTSGLVARDGNGQPLKGAGTLFVQPWVHTRSGALMRLDDAVPRGFLIVGASVEVVRWLDEDSAALWRQLDGSAVVIAASAPASDADCICLTEREKVFANWLGALGARAVLVRPDHYVYGIARNADELCRLVEQLGQSLNCHRGVSIS